MLVELALCMPKAGPLLYVTSSNGHAISELHSFTSPKEMSSDLSAAAGPG